MGRPRGTTGRGGARPTGVTESDSKRIIRQWNREIEDEIRREADRDAGRGPWKAVSWGAMWLLWLGLLVALLGQVKGLR